MLGPCCPRDGAEIRPSAGVDLLAWRHASVLGRCQSEGGRSGGGAHPVGSRDGVARAWPGENHGRFWQANSGAALGQLIGARRHARRTPGPHRRRAGRGRAVVPRARAASAAAALARRCAVPAAFAYAPAALDGIIGHIARCPIYVDVRQLRSTVGTQAVLDATQARKQRPLRRPRARPPRACTWTAHRGGAAMSAAMSPQVAARVSRALHHEFAGALPEPVITACPRDTVTDPHGSIDREALPQTAARPATARLTARAQARRHPGTAISPWVDRSSARQRTARPRRRPDRREQQ